MFKVCRSCGAEFQMWATECSDCGQPLQLSSGEELAPPEPPAPTVLEDLVLVKLGSNWELQSIAEELQQRGISSRIGAPPDASLASRASRVQAAQLALFVPRVDLEAVRAYTEELAAEERAAHGIPDIEHDANACPACGELLAESAASCEACGLEFPEVPAE